MAEPTLELSRGELQYELDAVLDIDRLDRATHLGHVGPRHEQALTAVRCCLVSSRGRYPVFEDLAEHHGIDLRAAIVDAHFGRIAMRVQRHANRRAGRTMAIGIRQYVRDDVF